MHEPIYEFCWGLFEFKSCTNKGPHGIQMAVPIVLEIFFLCWTRRVRRTLFFAWRDFENASRQRKKPSEFQTTHDLLCSLADVFCCNNAISKIVGYNKKGRKNEISQTKRPRSSNSSRTNTYYNWLSMCLRKKSSGEYLWRFSSFKKFNNASFCWVPGCAIIVEGRAKNSCTLRIFLTQQCTSNHKIYFWAHFMWFLTTALTTPI